MAQYTEEHLTNTYPGEINNNELLKDFNKYIRVDDEDDTSNYVVKGKCREHIDYVLMPQNCWKLLKQKYGCDTEIKRFKTSNNAFYGSFKITHHKIPILVLPPWNEISEVTELNKKIVFMGPKDTFVQMKEKVAKYLDVDGDKELRIWKTKFGFNERKFCTFLREKLDDYKTSNGDMAEEDKGKTNGNEDDEETEENCSVQFPGIQFELLLK